MLDWLVVASHLKKTVRQAKRLLTHAEFLIWCHYLKTEHERPDMSHYYLAQIAREVRTVLMKNADAKKFKINDFLLSFKNTDPPKSKPVEEVVVEDDVPSEDEIRKRTRVSQAYWFAWVGLKRKDIKRG
jgi:hypothetical protein